MCGVSCKKVHLLMQIIVDVKALYQLTMTSSVFSSGCVLRIKDSNVLSTMRWKVREGSGDLLKLKKCC